jgi:hypothetical protein
MPKYQLKDDSLPAIFARDEDWVLRPVNSATRAANDRRILCRALKAALRDVEQRKAELEKMLSGAAELGRGLRESERCKQELKKARPANKP